MEVIIPRGRTGSECYTRQSLTSPLSSARLADGAPSDELGQVDSCSSNCNLNAAGIGAGRRTRDGGAIRHPTQTRGKGSTEERHDSRVPTVDFELSYVADSRRARGTVAGLAGLALAPAGASAERRHVEQAGPGRGVARGLRYRVRRLPEGAQQGPQGHALHGAAWTGCGSRRRRSMWTAGGCCGRAETWPAR